MSLDDYFNVLGPDDIRIKGTRIGIESVLYEYIHRSRTPEQIAVDLDSLTLEQIYATILYYLRNRSDVDDYLAAWIEYGEQARAAQVADPAFQDFQQRLRQARASRLDHELTTPAGVRSA